MKNYIQAFFWGIIVAMIAMVVEVMILPANMLSSKMANYETRLFLIYLVVFIFLEEIIKYIIVKKQISQIFIKQKIIIGAFVCGIGFSTVEVMAFYQKVLLENGIFNWVLGGSVILVHLITFTFFGYRISKRNKEEFDWLAVLLAILLHAVYNLGVFKL